MVGFSTSGLIASIIKEANRVISLVEMLCHRGVSSMFDVIHMLKVRFVSPTYCFWHCWQEIR